MGCQKHTYLLETHQYSKILETFVRMIDDGLIGFMVDLYETSIRINR